MKLESSLKTFNVIGESDKIQKFLKEKQVIIEDVFEEDFEGEGELTIRINKNAHNNS